MTVGSSRGRGWLLGCGALWLFGAGGCARPGQGTAPGASRADERTVAAAAEPAAPESAAAQLVASEDGPLESYAPPDTPFDDFHDQVLSVAGPVTPPRKVVWAPPAYPGGELRAIEGRVVLESILGKDGAIRRVRVKRSLHPEFDRVSKEALERWRFEPARMNGRPVNVYYNLTVNFRRTPARPAAPSPGR